MLVGRLVSIVGAVVSIVVVAFEWLFNSSVLQLVAAYCICIVLSCMYFTVLVPLFLQRLTLARTVCSRPLVYLCA